MESDIKKQKNKLKKKNKQKTPKTKFSVVP